MLLISRLRLDDVGNADVDELAATILVRMNGQRVLPASQRRTCCAAQGHVRESRVRARELRGKPTDDLSFDVSRGCHVGCVWCVDP